MPHIFPFQRQIRWLVSLRIILFTVFLGISLLLEPVRSAVFTVSLPTVGAFIALVYFLSASSLILLPRMEKTKGFIHIQALCDVFFAAAIVLISGTSQSIFTTVFFFPVIAGSFLLPGLDRYIPAALATICYAGLLAAEHQGLAPGFGPQGLLQAADAVLLMHALAVRGITFFTVSFLTATLAGRLRRTEAALFRTTRDYDQLASLYHQILQDIPGGIVTVENGRISSFNPAAEKITGWTASRLLTRKFTDIFPNIDPGRFVERATVDFCRPDGECLRLGYSHSLLRLGEGGEDGADSRLLTLQDVGEIEKLEEQIRQKDKMAAIGEMAAAIAHELRNPLAAISGSIQMLAQDAVDAGSSRLFAIVLRETDRLDAVIRDFLYFSKPSRPEACWFSLEELVRDATANIRCQKATPAACDFQYDIPADSAWWGDPAQLRQVLINLLHNSCLVQGEDGGTVRITAAISQQGEREYGEIRIADSGPGIPAGLEEKIFEPFFTTRENGTGLGLAIVRQIIASHGGTVVAGNHAGGGALFVITLPFGSA